MPTPHWDNFKNHSATMSSRAPVHVSVEFISTRSGSKPAICIENPIDVTKSIGLASGKSNSTIFPTDFASLKLGLINIIEDSEYDMHFHNDSENNYAFDEKQFSHGAIYCRTLHRRQSINWAGFEKASL